MNALRVGLFAYGYWGTNWARVIRETDGLELAEIVEPDADRRILAARRYPDVETRAIGSSMGSLDAIVVATPTSTHYAICEAALRLGLHVLVTKPMAASLREAEALAALAEAQGRVLLVDHTFVYTGAVRKLRELAAVGDLGDVLYADSVRINLGLFQPDVDVLWDLAPHDLSILRHVLGEDPSHVAAVGSAPVRHGAAEMAHLTLWYPAGTVAHVHVNWLSPVKVRRMLFGGSRRMAVYDDLEPTEKVRVYDAGVDPRGDVEYGHLVDYRTGDVVAPKLSFREALAVEAEHFAACCRGEAAPLTGGSDGVAVVRALEAASRSLAWAGTRVRV